MNIPVVIFSLSSLSICLSSRTICTETPDISYGGLKVDCSYRGLTVVPPDLPQSATTLILSLNNITSLRGREFMLLSKLRYLEINMNPLRSLSPVSFVGLSALEVLEINVHLLDYTATSIPETVFQSLTSLKKFSLRSDVTRFREDFDPPAKAISFMKNLTHLNIDTSATSKFLPDFSKLGSLTELVLGLSTFYNKDCLCGLSEITNDTFTVFTSLPIHHLQLDSCSFVSFPDSTFHSFPFLQSFSFTGGSIFRGNVIHVVNALRVYEYRNMSSIDLSNTNDETLNVGRQVPVHISLKPLANICLQVLSLRRNSIYSVDFDILFLPPPPPLSKCIQTLDLSRNAILGNMTVIDVLFLNQLSNLIRLDLSNQKIFALEDFIEAQQDFARNTYSENHDIPVPVLLPRNLSYLDFGGAIHRIGSLHAIKFIGAENLAYLNLSFSGMSGFRHRIYGLQNVETLDLSLNDMSMVVEDFFDTWPNVVTLRLSHAFLIHFDQIGKRLLQPLQKLQNLDLTSNDFVYLPSDIFDDLLELRVVQLAFNKLLTVPDVTSLPHISYLHLSFNSFTYLSAEYRNVLDTVAKRNPNFGVSLGANIFSCLCETSDFLLWLAETEVTLDGGNYSCMDSTGHITFTKNILSHWSSFQRACYSSFWLNMAFGGLSLLVLILIASFVFVENKMKFKLLFLRMIGQNIYPRKREEFLYDAVIFYAESLRPWVIGDLKAELEGRRHLKLYLEDRDGDASGLRLHEIVNSIRDSWKIVLTLTNEFAADDFAFFIMINCVSSITLTTPKRLILLIDKDYKLTTNVSFLLKAAIERNIIRVDFTALPFPGEFMEQLHALIVEKEETDG